MALIRVSIFTDDPLFREGLRQLILADPSFVIIEGDRPAREGIGPDAADVLLVDSGTEGVLDHCANLKADRPRLLCLSVPNDAWAIDALAAGARGIIRKGDAITDILRAIPTVNEGRVWAPRHVLVGAWLRQERGAVVEKRLSARECEVVRCVAAGMSNKALADRLAIRPATVKAHLTNVYQKLGVRGRGELTALYHGAPTAGRRIPLRRPA